MDIVVWLRSLGLGKYEAAFRENDIDEKVLPSLSHETLKDLGVTSVGHRLKLLEAITALRTNEGSKAPNTGLETATRSTEGIPRGSRRTPSGDGDVLGSRRLYSALRSHGP